MNTWTSIDGEWRVVIPYGTPTVGSTISVERRDGTTAEAQILSYIGPHIWRKNPHKDMYVHVAEVREVSGVEVGPCTNCGYQLHQGNSTCSEGFYYCYDCEVFGNG